MTEQFEDSRTLQETSMDPKLKLGTKSTIKKVLLFVLTGFVIVASVWVSILYLGNQKEAGDDLCQGICVALKPVPKGSLNDGR